MGKRFEAALKVKPILQKGAQSLGEAEALKVKGVYFAWDDLKKPEHEYHTVKKGFKFSHNGQLYKTEQPEYTFVEHYVPGEVGTESLFTKIDETHAGTIDDPKIAARGMEYTYGQYYTDPEDGLLYYCWRNGEAAGGVVVLQYLPHELVGQYFETVVIE